MDSKSFFWVDSKMIRSISGNLLHVNMFAAKYTDQILVYFPFIQISDNIQIKQTIIDNG